MIVDFLIRIIIGVILALALLLPYKYKDKMEHITDTGLKYIEIYTIIYVVILLLVID